MEILLYLQTQRANGPFVYRLGRQIFILERGVRFPYGLLKEALYIGCLLFYANKNL